MSQETLLLSIIIDDVTCQFDNEDYFRENVFVAMQFKQCLSTTYLIQIPNV